MQGEPPDRDAVLEQRGVLCGHPLSYGQSESSELHLGAACRIEAAQQVSIAPPFAPAALPLAREIGGPRDHASMPLNGVTGAMSHIVCNDYGLPYIGLLRLEKLGVDPVRSAG